MVTVWIGVLGLSVVMMGCPKAKKPAPAPMDTDGRRSHRRQRKWPSRPRPSTQEDKTPDPLAGDIVEAMEYAYQQGLLGDVYFDFDKYELKDRVSGATGQERRVSQGPSGVRVFHRGSL